jgi:hypothetical protein
MEMNNGASNYLFEWLRSVHAPEALPTRGAEGCKHDEGEDSEPRSALERWRELTNVINR